MLDWGIFPWRDRRDLARLAVSRRPRVFVPMLLALLFVLGANIDYAQAQQANQNASAPAPTQTKKDPTGASVDYEAALKELAASYEQEVERLAKQNSQLKDLYGLGVIARVELEATDKSLADAQAKLEETRKQIAAAALKPAIAPTAGDRSNVSDQAWTTGDQGIDKLIHDNGNRYGVDPYLIYCVISQESSFKSKATSPKGAHGLMQLMPKTAVRYGVTNRSDAAQNIMGGTHYLKDLLQLFNGQLELALAGYNAGEGAVIKHGYKIPPYAETQAYVRLISMRYLRKGVALAAKT